MLRKEIVKNRIQTLFMGILAMLCLMIATSAYAQSWSDYEVDGPNGIIQRVGNTVYTGGPNGCSVEAIAVFSSGSTYYSVIEVRFKRTYYAPPGFPSVNTTPTGHQTGTKTGSPAYASTSFYCYTGSMGYNTDSLNPYDKTDTTPTTTFSPQATRTVTLYAYARNNRNYPTTSAQAFCEFQYKP
jgi:hypothetical protein